MGTMKDKAIEFTDIIYSMTADMYGVDINDAAERCKFASVFEEYENDCAEIGNHFNLYGLLEYLDCAFDKSFVDEDMWQIEGAVCYLLDVGTSECFEMLYGFDYDEPVPESHKRFAWYAARYMGVSEEEFAADYLNHLKHSGEFITKYYGSIYSPGAHFELWDNTKYGIDPLMHYINGEEGASRDK